MITMAMMTIASETSPTRADTILAPISIMTRKFLNCAIIFENRPSPFFSVSSFGPYFSNRDFASSLLRPMLALEESFSRIFFVLSLNQGAKTVKI